jgi:ubiquitin C-terminal hydrolase
MGELNVVYIRVMWMGMPKLELQSDGMESLVQPEKRQHVTLSDCLQTYCAQEKLTETERWECSSCHERVRATKKLSVSKTPDILIVHLKRFRVNQAAFGRVETVKNHERVVFPCGDMETLDLKPFIVGDACSTDITNSEFSRSTKYRLYAVAQHHGATMRFGHYTAVAQNFDTKEWYKFNDSYTTNIEKKYVFDNVVNKSAYVLFYQRVAPEERERTCQRETDVIQKRVSEHTNV